MPRILALDYGKRRIGVAISDETGIIAMPFCTIQVRNTSQTLCEIRRICTEKEVSRIIVGMPLNMNGDEGEQAKNASGFAKQIGEHLNIPTEMWDERLSTRIAERALIDGNMSRNKRKRVIDKIAAQIVLQNYLDAK